MAEDLRDEAFTERRRGDDVTHPLSRLLREPGILGGLHGVRVGVRNVEGGDLIAIASDMYIDTTYWAAQAAVSTPSTSSSISC